MAARKIVVKAMEVEARRLEEESERLANEIEMVGITIKVFQDDESLRLPTAPDNDIRNEMDG